MKKHKEITNFAECKIKFSTSKPVVLVKYYCENIQLQATKGLISSPTNRTVRITKDDILIYSSTTIDDLHLKPNGHESDKKILISEGQYEFSLMLEAHKKTGRQFVNENSIKGQVRINVALVIHSGKNQYNFISGLAFGNLENNLHLLEENSSE